MKYRASYAAGIAALLLVTACGSNGLPGVTHSPSGPATSIATASPVPQAISVTLAPQRATDSAGSLAGFFRATIAGPHAATFSGPTSFCYPASSASPEFSVQGPGKGAVVSISTKITATHGPGDYTISASGLSLADLELLSKPPSAVPPTVVDASSGTARINTDGKSGSIKADFPTGDHAVMTFTCG